MSLTTQDLQDIRQIVEGAVDPIKGELEALRNDIKEIYNMIGELNGKTLSDAKFQKLSLKRKLLALNSELIAAADQAGIDLPRS